jgi:hypothetical protein
MKFAAAALSCAVLFAVASTVCAADHSETAAESATRAWLALIDSGNYAKSWDAASPFFRQSIPQSEWQTAAANARAPLGKLVSRTLRSATFTRTIPNAPDGEYVIVIFTSVFETKGSGIETVTSMVDGDGTWRVSGYYIR